MGFVDNKMGDVSSTMTHNVFLEIIQVPSKLSILRMALPHFHYENRNIRPALGLTFTDSLTEKQSAIATKYLSGLESVTLGFSLHYMVGSSLDFIFSSSKIGFDSKFSSESHV